MFNATANLFIFVKMNPEQIQQIHPIFKAKGVHIYWKGSVGKVNTRGEVQPRYLIIASVGIFLMIKRTFPSGYKLSRTIPMTALTKITLTTDCLCLDSDDESMIIQHEKINDITALLLSIQTEINGNAVFKASTQLKMLMNDQNVEVHQNRCVIDRFQSECLACKISIQIDQINSLCKTLDSDKETITFTPVLAASPFMPAIVNTLKGKFTYKTLVLKDVSFMNFFPQLTKILETSESIETIIFNRVSFIEKNLSVPQNIFEKFISPITTVKFIKCDLTNPRSRELIYEIAKFKCHITNLIIDNCKFIQQSLEALFYSIFDSPCFKSLTKVVFCKINLVDSVQVFAMQLANCDWVLKNKSLKILKLQSMPLKLDVLLNCMTIFETGIEELSLSGSSFTHPLQDSSIQTFQDITTLDLSGISTSPGALIGLFSLLNKVPSKIVSLDFTSFKMNFPEISDFYSRLGTLKLGKVQTLVWDGNLVPADKIEAFIHFLSAQTNLIDLSVSNCFLGSPDSAEGLMTLAETLNLERFVMVGSGKCIYGPEINQVLSKMMSKGTLTSLDITGHAIGDEGIKLLTNFVNTTGKVIAFGKTNTTHAESLLKLLKLILEADIEYAMWPSLDVKRVITKVPLGQRDKVIKEYGSLKKKFQEKFKLEPEQEDTQPEESEEGPIRLRRLSSIPLLIRSNSDSMLVTRVEAIDYEMATFKEDRIKNLLSECIGANSIQPLNDPLLVYYNEFLMEHSIDKFLI